MSKRYSQKWKIASRFLLLAIIAGIVISEMILRKQYINEYNKLVSKYEGRELDMQVDEDPRLIYSFKPNKSGFNSQGYRDYEYPYKKDEGTFRMVVIGDSIAQGQEIELEESFPKVLERRLNVNTNGKKYEVIVLATTGYSTVQELVLLKEEAFEYNPDLILWSYCLNDPAHPVFHSANAELGRYFFKPKIHLFHFLSKKIFYFIEKIKGEHCVREYHQFLHCAYWNEVVSNIKKIKKISDQWKTPVVFLIHPIFEQGRTYAAYSLAGLHYKLKDVATKQGLRVIDLLDVYKNYNSNFIKHHSEHWYDCWHPNAVGHLIAAEYIYRRLVAENML